LRQVVAAGVRALTSTPPTLAELFLRHYGDELSDPDRDGEGRSSNADGTARR
jgi:ABC-2 type transport system ATP-binding protein